MKENLIFRTKKFIRHLPFFEKVRRIIQLKVRKKSNNQIFKTLEKNTYPYSKNIMKVLKNLEDGPHIDEKDLIQKIEKERNKLLKNYDLLIAEFEDYSITNDEDITIKRACEASKDSHRAFLLYSLTRILKPKNVIELGTNVGISSAYIATALKVNGKDSSFITLDLSPNRLNIAKKVHDKLDLKNISYVEGYFSDTLNSTLESLKQVDLVFLDGHHKYEPTLDYF